MENQEIWHVIVEPPAKSDANLIAKAAAVLNRDLYGTQLILAGNLPHIIVHCQTVEEAKSIARRLIDLHISAFVYPNSELRRTSATIFKAHALRFGQGEFIFNDVNGTSKALKTGAVYLILKAKAQFHTEKVVTKPKTRLNLPATLLTGGIPIRSKTTEKIVETDFQTEYFMRLYLQNSSESAVEIRQNGFDYSCLGARMSMVTLSNFNAVLETMKEFCPQSIFDDRLAKSFRASSSSNASQVDIDIQCKLIYLSYNAAERAF